MTASIGRRSAQRQRIRSAVTYSVNEIVELLDVHPNTVRRWLRADLRSIDNARPLLVLGAELIAFLRKMRSERRHRCLPNEFFCFRCRLPRRPCPGSVTIEFRNKRLLALHGLCEVCGTRVNRAGSVTRRTEYEKAFASLTLREEHIGVPTGPNDNGAFAKEARG